LVASSFSSCTATDFETPLARRSGREHSIALLLAGGAILKLVRGHSGQAEPKYARAATDCEKAASAVGGADPALGFNSATLGNNRIPLAQVLMDATSDVLPGRRPLSDFDQIIKDWQNTGGNQIRTDLQQVLAAS
jgi:hypothetical protein